MWSRLWVVTMGAAVVLPVFAGGWAAAQVPESVDPALVPNYRRLEPGLAAAGRPSPEALRKLKEWGFKTVIDLRTASEDGVAEDRAAVTAVGLRYVSIPVSPLTFRREDVEAVSKVLSEEGAGPVLLHCASSNRVGGVWAVMQVQAGKSLAAAEEEGRKAGLRSAAMVEAVKRVAGELARPAQTK